MIYGLNSLTEAETTRYRELDSAVRMFIDSIQDDCDRAVMEDVYIRCKSSVAVGMDAFYSDRQIRRIVERILTEEYP